MCTTSMIYDFGIHNPPWQNPVPYPLPIPYTPLPLPDPQAAEAIKKFLALLEAAKKYDDATGQRDCEDAEKACFVKQILDRLDDIEKRLAKTESK